MKRFHNLVELIEENRRSDTGITFIESSDEEHTLSYNALYQKAGALLHGLNSRGVGPGHEVILQIEDNESFITAFWACILGGIIPVPVTVGSNDEHRRKLLRIFGLLKRPWLLATATALERFGSWAKGVGMEDAVTNLEQYALFIEDLPKSGEQGQSVNPKPEETAFIQFSSGSTGEPRGVVLTHENLVYNIEAIHHGIGTRTGDKSFSWMPLTHDMGLIGFHLSPLAAGVDQIIMPTSRFIRAPMLWLAKASEHKATILSSPNFGYKYLLDSFKESGAEGWDLSGVRLIFNGAEPIIPQLCHQFMERMAPFGLRKDVMFTVYGLAEASLAATFPATPGLLEILRVDRNSLACGEKITLNSGEGERTIELVNLGKPVLHCGLRICDEEGIVLDEDRVGLIHISGRNVTSGYYNRPEETKEIITGDGWLNTGDLGFLHQGNLYITGRAKDVLFVNGQNFYAHDIERVAQDVEGITLGKVAACGVLDQRRQTDTVVIFILHRKSAESFLPLARSVKAHMGKTLGLDVTAVVPVRTIPRTTSGKVQRYKLGEVYQQGEFDSILAKMDSLEKSESENTEEEVLSHTLQRLIAHCREITKNPRVHPDMGFMEAGGDSLKAVSLALRVQKDFGVEVSLDHICGTGTLRELAELMDHALPVAYKTIEKAERNAFYPLSPQQQRLYVLDSLEGQQNTAYNIPAFFRIEGNLDEKRLEEALRTVINRHEVIRTSFRLQDGVPVQTIHDHVSFDMEHMDLSAEPDREDPLSETALQSVFSRFVRPFDLDRPPLFRAGLLRLKEQLSVLMVDMHHIISDGTSMAILANEVTAVYNGAELSEPELQYKDYSRWFNNRMAQGVIKQQEAFWAREFEGEVPVLHLPLDRPRPPVQDFAGGRVGFIASADLTRKLKELALRKEVSLFSILFASYFVFLSKYTGTEDLVVGTTSAGRQHPDLENLPGMFVNTLAIRCFPTGSKRMENFLTEVHEKNLLALNNQDYQFEALLEQLDIPRDFSRNPLFDTMFVFQNMKKAVLDLNGLTINTVPYENTGAKFDLTLFAEETDGKLAFELEYAKALFDRETVESMTGHYLNILKGMTEQSESLIQDVSMLSPDEEEALIRGISVGRMDRSKDTTIIELFQRQARLTPNRTAVEYRDIKLTYRELSAMVNQVTEQLISKGVVPGDIVAIMAPRSHRVIIAMLAVLKAGSAYLPIDPDYPDERITFMLEDSGVKTLLADQASLRSHSCIGADGPVAIELDETHLFMDDQCDPGNRAKPDGLAYVIYTSGSTGKPKGAMVQHRGLVNYIRWAASQYIRGEQVALPLYTSISFDLTVTSVYMPLITGGRIIAYDECEDILIRRILEDNQAHIIKLTPSHMKLIRDADYNNSNVRTLIVGGEQLETALARDIQASFGKPIEIINEYGPTETVVGCMIHRFNRETDSGGAVPIGMPADNVRIYVLDKYLKPVPKRVCGEIFISGMGVGGGYLNRPELTAERFMTDPFCPGLRMYKTGDLARWLPDGKLVFMGRLDNQVKIKGHRVETGEIESCLMQHPNVRNAVVLSIRETGGELSLAAYLVLRDNADINMIREDLLKTLPAYMVPSWIIPLEALPLTAHGKVDQKALPEPWGFSVNQGGYKAPENDVQATITRVWQEVLHVDRVGVEDDFYQLGGDSIKALQIVSRLSQEGIHTHVRDVMMHKTISKIYERRNHISDAVYEQGAVKGEFRPTPIMKWFFSNDLKEPGFYQQSVLLAIQEPIEAGLLKKAFEVLIRHHDGLRLNFDPISGKMFYNPVHLDRSFNLGRFDLSTPSSFRIEDEIERCCTAYKSGLDITSDLLLKAALIDRGENGSLLFVTAHHLIMDGVSWRIIIEDLSHIYKALQAGIPVSLPAKTASVLDWSRALETYAREEAPSQAALWSLHQSSDSPSLPSSQDLLMRAGMVSKTLDVNDTRLLFEAGIRNRASVEEVLLSALLGAVTTWKGDCETVIELEGHGRGLEGINLSRTVGWMTSLYPVRFEAAPKQITARLRMVKEELRKIPDGGVGYGVLRADTDKSHETGNFMAVLRFNYMGRFDPLPEGDLFTPADYPTGSESGPMNKMTIPMEINMMVIRGQIKIQLHFSRVHNPHEITTLMGYFIEELRRFIHNKEAEEGIALTSTDFLLADMKKEDLDTLFDEHSA